MNPKAKSFYPSISEAIGILIVFILLSILFGMLPAIGNLAKNKFFQDLLMLFSYVLAAGGTVLIAIRIKKVQHPDSVLLINKIPRISTYILSVILTLAVIIVLEPLNELVTRLLPMPEQMQQLFNELFSPTFPAFLTAVIAAPILEEMIFRGVILEGFLRNYNPVKAILIVNLMFGLAHLNVWQFVGAFMVGIFISWVYWKTRSLSLAILIHMVNNMVSYLAIYFSSKPMQYAVN